MGIEEAQSSAPPQSLDVLFRGRRSRRTSGCGGWWWHDRNGSSAMACRAADLRDLIGRLLDVRGEPGVDVVGHLHHDACNELRRLLVRGHVVAGIAGCHEHMTMIAVHAERRVEPPHHLGQLIPWDVLWQNGQILKWRWRAPGARAATRRSRSLGAGNGNSQSKSTDRDERVSERHA